MKSKDSSKQKSKQKVFDEWMEGDHVLVQLDARHEGVSVPSHLADNAALTLKLSYRFQGSTTADEKGIVSYLRFAGDYSECVIPWDAIWGMTSAEKQTEVWTEDVPKEVLLQIACSKISDFGKKLFQKGGNDEKNTSGEEEVPCRPAPVLAEAESVAEKSACQSEETTKVHRKKPNLKLVK